VLSIAGITVYRARKIIKVDSKSRSEVSAANSEFSTFPPTLLTLPQLSLESLGLSNLTDLPDLANVEIPNAGAHRGIALNLPKLPGLDHTNADLPSSLQSQMWDLRSQPELSEDEADSVERNRAAKLTILALQNQKSEAEFDLENDSTSAHGSVMGIPISSHEKHVLGSTEFSDITEESGSGGHSSDKGSRYSNVNAISPISQTSTLFSDSFKTPNRGRSSVGSSSRMSTLSSFSPQRQTVYATGDPKSRRESIISSIQAREREVKLLKLLLQRSELDVIGGGGSTTSHRTEMELGRDMDENSIGDRFDTDGSISDSSFDVQSDDMSFDQEVYYDNKRDSLDSLNTPERLRDLDMLKNILEHSNIEVGTAIKAIAEQPYDTTDSNRSSNGNKASQYGDNNNYNYNEDDEEVEDDEETNTSVPSHHLTVPIQLTQQSARTPPQLRPHPIKSRRPLPALPGLPPVPRVSMNSRKMVEKQDLSSKVVDPDMERNAKLIKLIMQSQEAEPEFGDEDDNDDHDAITSAIRNMNPSTQKRRENVSLVQPKESEVFNESNGARMNRMSSSVKVDEQEKDEKLIKLIMQRQTHPSEFGDDNEDNLDVIVSAMRNIRSSTSGRRQSVSSTRSRAATLTKKTSITKMIAEDVETTNSISSNEYENDHDKDDVSSIDFTRQRHLNNGLSDSLGDVSSLHIEADNPDKLCQLDLLKMTLKDAYPDGVLPSDINDLMSKVAGLCEMSYGFDTEEYIHSMDSLNAIFAEAFRQSTVVNATVKSTGKKTRRSSTGTQGTAFTAQTGGEEITFHSLLSGEYEAPYTPGHFFAYLKTQHAEENYEFYTAATAYSQKALKWFIQDLNEKSNSLSHSSSQSEYASARRGSDNSHASQYTSAKDGSSWQGANILQDIVGEIHVPKTVLTTSGSVSDSDSNEYYPPDSNLSQTFVAAQRLRAQEELTKELNRILKTFIIPGAPKEVNIPHSVRKNIIIQHRDGKNFARILDAAVSSVVTLMKTSSFPLFKKEIAFGRIQALEKPGGSGSSTPLGAGRSESGDINGNNINNRNDDDHRLPTTTPWANTLKKPTDGGWISYLWTKLVGNQ